jgi:hypothetical protein
VLEDQRHFVGLLFLENFHVLARRLKAVRGGRAIAVDEFVDGLD